MKQRLTQNDAVELRAKLLRRINAPPHVFQSAGEWQQSGLTEYTRAQVKRQLEVLVRAGKVHVRRSYPGVYYGPMDE